jgi:poly-beta-1,6-N-acetyl-D-glucosamine biosynthesis protein PgaD
MDQPGPRHQADRLPLIIDRPDLIHPARRLLALLLTLTAWVFWFVLWLPFVAAVGRYFGYQLPAFSLPSPISLDAFLALLEVAPYVVLVAIAVTSLSYLHQKFKARSGKPEKRWRPVGMEQLATGLALDPKLLADWQSAQILYVEHGPLGRVTNAHTSLPPSLSFKKPG